MDEIGIAVLVGMGAIFAPQLMKLPSVRNRYKKMDKQKLIDGNVNARMMLKYTVVLTVLLPFLCGLILSGISDSSRRTHAISVCILLLMTLVGGTCFFWEIVRITKTEIEYRKTNSYANPLTNPPPERNEGE